jgi:hypothetical protein
MSTDKPRTPAASTGEVASLSRPPQGEVGTNGGAYVPKLQQKAEKLRNVAQEVESFLMRQIDRLQRELEQAETWGDRHELERLTDEFEQMRQKWDSERQLERSRLQEDSQRLAEAWQKLEAEQRDMLKYRVTNSKLAGLGAGRLAPRAASSHGPMQPVTAGTESALARKSGGVTTAVPTGHKTQMQFQQLRREMMEHARQRGKR